LGLAATHSGPNAWRARGDRRWRQAIDAAPLRGVEFDAARLE
jgi:hypothetical protein